MAILQSSLYAAVGAPYTGLVATSGLVADSVNAGNNQVMNRSKHIARESITGLQLVFGNFYVAAANGPANGTEVGAGAAMTLEASIEYPAGTYTRVLFGGANQGSVPNGGLLVSDTLEVTVPFGAGFWVRTWYSCSAGIVFCSGINYGNGFAFGTTTPNLVMGGGDPGTGFSLSYSPVAIIGTTRRPSVGLIGDSRVYGSSDSLDTTLARGTLARTLAPLYGYANLAVGSDRAAWFASNSANRRAILAYCSHVLCGYGVNDLYAAAGSVATLQANLQTIYGLASITGKPVWQTTLEPLGVGSTDAFITEANQTTGSATPDTNRKAFNEQLRGGSGATAYPQLNIVGVIDVAGILESRTTAGKWGVGLGSHALTNDGTHANYRGNRAIQSAGIVPQLLTR